MNCNYHCAKESRHNDTWKSASMYSTMPSR